jgi:hypothetical protein
MRRLIATCVLSLALLPAAHAQSSARSTTADLLTLAEELRTLREPAVADRVPDYSPAAVTRWQKGLAALRARHAALDSRTWPVADRVDHVLVGTQLNAFDFVVTVALGSILATVLLSKDVALVEGVVAFSLLVALQWLIAWLSVRSRVVSSAVKSDPTLLLYRGRLLTAAMKRQRVTREEVMAAVRGGGHAGLEAVHAVVLETDGSFSVIGSAPEPDASNSALPFVPPP